VRGEGGRHRARVVDPESMGSLDPYPDPGEGPTKIINFIFLRLMPSFEG
jgi:hypothetical protein